MTLSVALATFNGARFLGEQLESVAGQERLPDELVVCDDGSSDDTTSIIEAFARQAPFEVRLSRNTERLGFANNFMRAISQCKGDVIALCDQDDVWLPQKLARCEEVLQGEDVLLAIHTSLLVDDALAPTGKAFPEIRADRVEPPLGGDPWLSVRGMSMAFSARLCELAAVDRPASHYANGPLNHDEWIYMLARALGSVAYIAEPLALYRIHGGNVTGDRGGAGRRISEAATTGAAYYARRRQQALALARVLRGAAQWPIAARGAAAHETLAARLAAREDVYTGSRRERLRALRRAWRAGVYDGRGQAGFGLRGIARDAALIAAGRR